MNIESIAKELRKRNLSEVSRDTKISYPTILRIANGLGETSKWQTLKQLNDYLFGVYQDEK